jgi:hypothetical protein
MLRLKYTHIANIRASNPLEGSGISPAVSKSPFPLPDADFPKFARHTV